MAETCKLGAKVQFLLQQKNDMIKKVLFDE